MKGVTNAHEIGDIENIVANMEGKEQERFNRQVMMNRMDEVWCVGHGVDFVNANVGIVIRDTYREMYIVGEDQSR